MAEWHTKASVNAQWRGSIDISDDVLEELLETAQDAVLEYAPAFEIPEGEASTWIPTRYRRAQLYNIEDEWNSSTEGPGSDVGQQEYDNPTGTARIYRLSPRARRLLRPETGTPMVG